MCPCSSIARLGCSDNMDPDAGYRLAESIRRGGKRNMAELQPAETSVDKPVTIPHSIRRIMRIAQHAAARSYLEIGVCRGRTFNRVDFERKVAVDPRFQFDVANY